MMKIILLEDQADQAERLQMMLERYRREHEGFSCSFQHYDNSIRLLTEYSCDADVLFLDIQMPDILGIDVARKIREKDERVMIVFITMLSKYAIEGYSVGAFDYILKPVRYEEFSAKMDRVMRMFSHKTSQVSIEVRTREETHRILADDITFIEVADHDICIHTPAQTYRHWGSLKRYEEQLKDAHFVRCNACYLVNLKYVKGIRKDMVLVHETELAISGPKRKAFLAALAQYKGGSR